MNHLNNMKVFPRLNAPGQYFRAFKCNTPPSALLRHFGASSRQKHILVESKNEEEMRRSLGDPVYDILVREQIIGRACSETHATTHNPGTGSRAINAIFVNLLHDYTDNHDNVEKLLSLGLRWREKNSMYNLGRSFPFAPRFAEILSDPQSMSCPMPGEIAYCILGRSALPTPRNFSAVEAFCKMSDPYVSALTNLEIEEFHEQCEEAEPLLSDYYLISLIFRDFFYLKYSRNSRKSFAATLKKKLCSFGAKDVLERISANRIIDLYLRIQMLFLLRSTVPSHDDIRIICSRFEEPEVVRALCAGDHKMEEALLDPSWARIRHATFQDRNTT